MLSFKSSFAAALALAAAVPGSARAAELALPSPKAALAASAEGARRLAVPAAGAARAAYDLDAKTLAPLPAFALEAGAAKEAPAEPSCATALAELRRWELDRAELDGAAVDYLERVAETISRWHWDLQRLEGRVVQIAFGAFSPLRQAAFDVQGASRRLEQRQRELQDRHAQLLSTVGGCLKPETR